MQGIRDSGNGQGKLGTSSASSASSASCLPLSAPGACDGFQRHSPWLLPVPQRWCSVCCGRRVPCPHPVPLSARVHSGLSMRLRSFTFAHICRVAF